MSCQPAASWASLDGPKVKIAIAAFATAQAVMTAMSGRAVRLPPGLDSRTFADMLVSTRFHPPARPDAQLPREALEVELRGRVPLVMDLIVRALPAC